MALTEVNSLGLKNSEVKTADIADEAVTIAKLEHGTSGNDGKFLRANNGADPTWETVDTSIANDSIAEVKLDIHNAPSTGQYLKYTSNGLEWATAQTGTDPNAMPKAGGTFTGDVIFDNQSNAGKDLTWDDSNDRLKFEDNTKAVFGTGNDFTINHGGTNTHLDNNTGNLVIRNNVAADVGGDIHIMPHDDEYGIIIEHDGPVTLLHNNVTTFKTTEHGAKVTSGEGQNTELYFHADEGDDNADIWKFVAFNSPASTFDLYNYTSGSWEKNIGCFGNGGVELYHNNNQKLTTASGGVIVTGDLVADNLYLGDNEKLYVGAGDDLQIYHDGSHSRIKNTTGYLILQSSTGILLKNDTDDENFIVANDDGSVELCHDGTKKLETYTGGVEIVGDCFFADNNKLKLGGSSDLQIFHNGQHSIIQNNEGNLYIWGADGHDGNIVIQATYGEESIICEHNGGVKLYYDNSIKFETKSTGPHLLGLSSGSGHSDVRYQTSDGRLYYDSSTRLVKTDIVDSPYGISALKQLKPRKYKRTDIEGTPDEIGFIADEVVGVIPEIVPFGPKSFYTKNDSDTEDIPINVDYRRMTAVLTTALQEAIAKIETLETKVAALEAA